MNSKTYSQYSQDLFLVSALFADKKNGIFVDIGANDGITYSNTLLLEELGWTGVCIEPIKSSFDKLVACRKCECINSTISSHLSEFVEFCEISGYSEMLSGIIEDYDERHKQRILHELQLYGGTKTKIKIKNYRFCDIIKHPQIDIVCIDTEGSELSVLNSIDFDNVKINYFLVENNYGDEKISKFMNNQNYKFIKQFGSDELYENTILF